MHYIDKLNELTHKRYRLPTEEEWEYACRGGRPGERYCGGDAVDAVAWDEENSGGRTHPVGQKQANGFGLSDMSGNVWEWTCSVYDAVYSYNGGQHRCADQFDSGDRALRGGSWRVGSGDVRAADRNWYTPTHQYDDYGFRLARDP